MYLTLEGGSTMVLGTAWGVPHSSWHVGTDSDTDSGHPESCGCPGNHPRCAGDQSWQPSSKCPGKIV